MTATTKSMFNFGDVEPVALLCNRCEKWSEYKNDYNNQLHRGWRKTNNGYQCNVCRKKKGTK